MEKKFTNFQELTNDLCYLFRFKHIALFLSLLLCFNVAELRAQQSSTSISGVIIDEDGLPLAGVSVLIKGSTKGVVTDVDGEYLLNAAKGDIIEFSSLGYEPIERVVGNRTTIDITLVEEVGVLESIVVVGYGQQKRETVIGSVSDVSGKQIMEAGVPNLSLAIQDALPGVVVTVSSGIPGADDGSLSVRGGSTPLILVDGVEVSDGFSQIDPSEVASISVLKDASATAVYGVKGADGVVLITTKRGSVGPAQFSVSASMTLKEAIRQEENVSALQLLEMQAIAAKNGGDWDLIKSKTLSDIYSDPNRDEELYPYFDWEDFLMNDFATEKNVRVNVTGGTEKVKYFASMSYTNQGDIFNTTAGTDYDPSWHFDKVNFRSNLDFQITPTTKLSTDISGRMEILNQPKYPTLYIDSYTWKTLDVASPFTLPYYSTDFIEAHPDDIYPWDGDIRVYEGAYLGMQMNPWRILNYYGYEQDRNDVLDYTLTLEQDLSFITKGLSGAIRYNRSTTSQYTDSEYTTSYSYFYDVDTETWSMASGSIDTSSSPYLPSGGESWQYYTDYTYYEGKLMYANTFADKHTVNAIGVFNRSIKTENITDFPYYREDWVARVTYDYMSKYMFEANGSYNGSERYAPGMRFGFFPSAAIGWNIAKENFVKDNASWIDSFKVRYSIGKTGTDGGSSRFMYLSGYQEYSTNYVPGNGYYGFGDPTTLSSTRYGEATAANPDATWETALTKNIGIDAAFFKNTLTLTVDLYNEYRTGIMQSVTLPTYYNAGVGTVYTVGSPSINIGETKKHGFEVDLQYRKQFGEVFFTVGGNIQAVEDRYTVHGSDLPYSPDYQKYVGQPTTATYSTWTVTDHYLNDIDELANQVSVSSVQSAITAGSYCFVDFDGDGVITSSDRVVSGSTQPDYTYGMNVGLAYKGWDLRLRFYGKEGNYHIATACYIYPYFEGEAMDVNTSHLDSWSPTNTDATYPSYYYGSDGTHSYTNATSALYTDCSYFRLQSAALSYNVSSDWLKRNLSISQMTLRLTGTNLFTITDVLYGDPEGGNGLTYNYPLTRRYIFGVDINF